LGPIPWFLVPEMFPDAVRATAMSLMTALNWICVTAVMLLWTPMKTTMGEMYAFVFYAGVLVAGIFYGIFMMKEPVVQAAELREALMPEADEANQGMGHAVGIEGGLLEVSAENTADF
jgi:hypothetical protein